MDLHQGEEILFEGHPSWRATMGFYLAGLVVVAVASAIAVVAFSTAVAVAVAVVAIALVVAVGLLKRIGTRYMVTTQRLHIRRGILARRVQQTRLERVQNVNTEQSFLERILQVGTVDFDTAGTDDSDFVFRGIANPEDVVAAVDRAQQGSAPV
jgi:uncharacterized membrane protein YdbT with pleckstrin-like domain